jgi:hypothetical protein
MIGKMTVDPDSGGVQIRNSKSRNPKSRQVQNPRKIDDFFRIHLTLFTVLIIYSIILFIYILFLYMVYLFIY